jgi:hypothetical protein
MKRLIYSVVIFGFLFAACEGPAGPTGALGPVGNTGATGATGATGPAGKDGTNGKDGAAGPAGPAGKDGKDGKDGINGTNGTNGINGANAVQPKIYDFNLDISQTLASYKWPLSLSSGDIVLVYINRGSSYSPLPFRGYCSTTDNLGFEKLDVSFDAWEFRVYIENETIIPNGSTFNFRAVILKGVKAGRLKTMAYEELKKLYDLPA